MAAALDLVGKRFKRLVVLERHPERNNLDKVQWVCRCDCGNEVITYTGALTSHNTKSCGCWKLETSSANGKARKTHGLTKTPEYKTWSAMKERCYKEDSCNYFNYGGRGIKVCDRWLESFENFLADMGFRPGPEFSLDREDNDGHYEPGNCRWATIETQSNNRRTNEYYEFEGEQLTLSQIARKLKMSRATLEARIKRGMSPEEAFTRKFHKKYFELNGESTSIDQIAKHFNVNYFKTYRHLVTLGRPVEDLAKIKEN